MLENDNNNIFLIGPMGSGKTSVGAIVAKILAKEFHDTDQEIEAGTGVDISYVFDVEGEMGFRKREEKLVTAITQKKNIVLATGGGAIESEKKSTLFGEQWFCGLFGNKPRGSSLESETKREKTFIAKRGPKEEAPRVNA